jgi:hypothetical protein
MQGSTFVEVKP